MKKPSRCPDKSAAADLVEGDKRSGPTKSAILNKTTIMAYIKHKYTKKELRDLGPEIKMQIGPDIHLLRAVKPKIVAKANTRIQKRIDLSYSKPAEILKRSNANRRAGTIFLNC